MNRLITRLMTIVLTSMISLSINPYKVADAGCNCERGSAVMHGMPMGSPYMNAMPAPAMRRQQAPMRALPPVSPPPGSLGYTYRNPSRLVPREKHPRDAMVEITCIPQGAIVNVDGMKGYITESGTWMFETKRPLLPHREHIYRIEVKMSMDQDHPEVYVIRLIPGRVVDYKYQKLDVPS